MRNKNLFPHQYLPKNMSLVGLAKNLRQAGNLAEVVFWQSFKSREVVGL